VTVGKTSRETQNRETEGRKRGERGEETGRVRKTEWETHNREVKKGKTDSERVINRRRDGRVTNRRRQRMRNYSGAKEE
jgi:hypothetical protein